MSKPRRRKIEIISFLKQHIKVILMIFVGLLGFLVVVEVVHMSFYTKVGTIEEARAAFTHCFDEIDRILEPYGLTTKLYRQEYSEEDEGVIPSAICTIQAEVPLGDGCLLQIELSTKTRLPPGVRLSLNGEWHDEVEECYSDLEGHSYLFDIASYLGDPLYSAERFRKITFDLQDTIHDKIDKEGTIIGEVGSKDVKSIFIRLGTINYMIDKQQNEITYLDEYRSRVSISNYLYLRE